MLNKYNDLKSKSLINNFLLSRGQVEHNHKINLSLIKAEKIKEELQVASGAQPFTVEIEIKGTGLKLKRDLYKLEDLSKQNIIKWCDEFRQISSSAGWSNATSVTVLKELVPDATKEELAALTTVETCLSKLLRMVYPERLAETFHMKAKTIKQRNYCLIENYSKALEKELRKYFIAGRLSEEVQKTKLQEMFYENLEIETRIYLFEKNIRKVEEAIGAISETEAFLLSLPLKHAYESKNMQSSEPSLGQKHINMSRTVKWCPKHRTAGHDKSECFANQSSNNSRVKETKKIKDTPSTSSNELNKKKFFIWYRNHSLS